MRDPLGTSVRFERLAEWLGPERTRGSKKRRSMLSAFQVACSYPETSETQGHPFGVNLENPITSNHSKYICSRLPTDVLSFRSIFTYSHRVINSRNQFPLCVPFLGLGHCSVGIKRHKLRKLEGVSWANLRKSLQGRSALEEALRETENNPCGEQE